MKIRLSERDEIPKLLPPPIEKLQKAFHIISEGLEDGLIRQVILTPRGKQTRWLDPLTRKLVKVIPHSFNLGYKSSDDSKMTTSGYNGSPFDFSKMEEKAKTMTPRELLWAMRDAQKAGEAMRSMEAIHQENWYADEAAVYRNELKRRGTVRKTSINLSKRDRSS